MDVKLASFNNAKSWHGLPVLLNYSRWLLELGKMNFNITNLTTVIICQPYSAPKRTALISNESGRPTDDT